MIMMRSTPTTTKMVKPPPPVPPRPSKTLVAEALAKTRSNHSNVAPIRAAPPPPSLNKSKSAVSVVCVAATVAPPPPPNYQRSISDEMKCSSRTIIFQSPKINKPNKHEVIKDKIVENIDLIDEKSKDDKKLIKSDSFKSIERNSDNEDGENLSNKKWDQILNDRNHVNTLIDEMFASVLEVSDDDKVTISTMHEDNEEDVKENNIKETIKSSHSSSSSTTNEKKVMFDDRLNHELLVSELENMRKEDEKIMKRQRKPSRDVYDCNRSSNGSNNAAGDNISSGSSVDVSKIHHWVEVNDGEEVRLSSCQITIDDLRNEDDDDDLKIAMEDEEYLNSKNVPKLDYERIKTMSSIHGLPPLPKSLSGFNLLDGQSKPPTPLRTSSMRGGTQPQISPNIGHLVYPPHPKNGSSPSETPGRKSTNLDSQLAILRREMYSLRQLDLSLLSQLWSLNESIQDFRQILQDQEDRILSPPSPSPTPSSGDEGDADEFYMSASSMNFRTPPPPLPVRRPSSSSNASSLG